MNSSNFLWSSQEGVRVSRSASTRYDATVRCLLIISLAASDDTAPKSNPMPRRTGVYGSAPAEIGSAKNEAVTGSPTEIRLQISLLRKKPSDFRYSSLDFSNRLTKSATMYRACFLLLQRVISLSTYSAQLESHVAVRRSPRESEVPRRLRPLQGSPAIDRRSRDWQDMHLPIQRTLVQ